MILLLGDSFADRMDRQGAWCDILSDMLGEDVENYGLASSSLSYSYNLFLKHYEPGKYSKVIFIATDRYRQFYYQIKPDIQTLSFQVDSDRSKQINYPKPLNSYHNKIFEGQELINVMYSNTYDWTEKAIRDSLNYRVKEPLLILDVMEQLVKIQKMDYDNLNIKSPLGLDAETDRRPNHLSMKQSYQLAGYIAKYFTENFDIHEIFNNPKDYFTVSKSKQEAGLI